MLQHGHHVFTAKAVRRQKLKFLFPRNSSSSTFLKLADSKCIIAPRALEEKGSSPVKSTPLSGMVFEDSAVQNEITTVEKTNAQVESLARINFHSECEAAINEQINTEYNVSYVYHTLYAYFGRDNVALPGIAAFFKHSSEEERKHAEVLMDFQNLRGGHVALKPILPPDMELNNQEKGDALQAFEIALSLEKLNFAKLRQLYDVASRHGDAQMEDFVVGKLLQEQAESVKKIAGYVSQLRRVGRGLGIYIFDREMALGISKPK